MAAATSKVSRIEALISVKEDFLQKLLMEKHNRSEFIKAFCDDFIELFWATWNNNHQGRSTPIFDDEISGVAIDSQVETDVEKVIDEKLEGVPVDLNSASNFTQQSSIPPVPDEVLGSFPTINRSHIFDESKMIEDEIVFKSKSTSLDSCDLSLVEGNFQSTPIIDFISVDGSSDVNEVQEHKTSTVFLDYQEGKPFNLGNESCDSDVGFQVRKVINGEVKGISLLNEFSGNTSSPLGVEESNYRPKLKIEFSTLDGATDSIQDYKHHIYTVEVKKYENPYYLKELFYLQCQLHCLDYSYLLWVGVRSLFDRAST
ncbi:uncharacterized protein LOC113353894 isoform X2 [Papaver somniferum]|uniref:uncharacterized protein LOC113353894 isoform X2 n=1 Tax=Papaver somniferum TaxID=3469 RepID=UPI000E703143|nr:uncharacterized protein LOC113353894 isoform X2 [Papaver somniferum]